MEKKKKSIELITEKVDFLSGMRIYHQEVAKSESYIRNCYDPRLRLYNRRWLTLVNKEYFEFGNKLMIKASSAMTQTILKTKKDPVGTSKLQIKEDKKLWNEFDSISSATNNKLCSGNERKGLYDELIEKVLNTRFSQEFRRYWEKYIVRRSKVHRLNQTTREGLKSIVPTTYGKKTVLYSDTIVKIVIYVNYYSNES